MKVKVTALILLTAIGAIAQTKQLPQVIRIVQPSLFGRGDQLLDEIGRRDQYIRPDQ